VTADEFEAAYAKRSRTTVAKLRAYGRIVAPCNCGDAMCEGWQSTTAERLAEEKRHDRSAEAHRFHDRHKAT
jgi:hypothetical protein